MGLHSTTAKARLQIAGACRGGPAPLCKAAPRECATSGLQDVPTPLPGPASLRGRPVLRRRGPQPEEPGLLAPSRYRSVQPLLARDACSQVEAENPGSAARQGELPPAIPRGCACPLISPLRKRPRLLHIVIRRPIRIRKTMAISLTIQRLNQKSANKSPPLPPPCARPP